MIKVTFQTGADVQIRMQDTVNIKFENNYFLCDDLWMFYVKKRQNSWATYNKHWYMMYLSCIFV